MAITLHGSFKGGVGGTSGSVHGERQINSSRKQIIRMLGKPMCDRLSNTCSELGSMISLMLLKKIIDMIIDSFLKNVFNYAFM